MESQIVEIDATDWRAVQANESWTAALEAGKVLYFPRLGFELLPQERPLLRADIRDPGSRNISLDVNGRLKGAAGDAVTQAAAAAMIGRFRERALGLIGALLPHYVPLLRMAPTSYRPMQVETRAQSWRADDRRLHVDSFPSRPNYGERILRVFSNINPHGQSRIWRIGEPFGDVAGRFLPVARRYSPLQARLLRTLRVTKSLRSEYDHLMLQLHDFMKFDTRYQQEAPQQTMAFPPGSAWVCFSDQTVHAAMSGQHMIERTFHLPVASQYNPEASPLAILTRLAGHPLI